ncbi:hypothetical protein [Moritella viscosa]|uniref:Uncharacterized protein n=1 Tax=Moritella viscosa TaxID=80854 RepID=A0ABY1HDI7_9GAMM|nr:hypothetical protein [Moritella viscosa]CED61896.1 putative uncharacterized protein [Moritella viscosa]SGY91298.1 Putative uncharacterized protein [Moritella viscosa]SGZ17221.1 Putative uncharacterized protein [Moritella viscosa]SHO07448.1 Putative uncharacterized protein [Moritella viscosa]SHO21908.1 Putative uncharacterized protein [Moritella viscosa]
MADTKTGFINTPSGVERSMQTIHGALLCEETIVLLGMKAKTIDFKQYDTETAASSVFAKLVVELKKADVQKGDYFIELPNGNLLRKGQIMAIELISTLYKGFILRNEYDEIVDFVGLLDESKHETFKVELLKALEVKVKKPALYQPDWDKLGLR